MLHLSDSSLDNMQQGRTCVTECAAACWAEDVMCPVLPDATMWHTHPQPYQEQCTHRYELHEEVGAVWQCSTQDGRQV